MSLRLGYNMGHHWTEVFVSRKVIVELILSGHSTIIITNILTVDKYLFVSLKIKPFFPCGCLKKRFFLKEPLRAEVTSLSPTSTMCLKIPLCVTLCGRETQKKEKE